MLLVVLRTSLSDTCEVCLWDLESFQCVQLLGFCQACPVLNA